MPRLHAPVPRIALPAAAALALTLPTLSPPAAAQPGPVLVLPFRTIGVSDTTARVSQGLLAGELRALGLTVLASESDLGDLPRGDTACDDPECAATLARSRGAEEVIYGSMSRLGKKIIVRLSALRPGGAPFFSDQMPAQTEEDLDTLMRRFAQAIAGGRPDAGRATVETVLEAESIPPRLRATRSGLGFRSGFLYPVRKSYAGADRLTNLHIVYKYERPHVLIETTTALGLTFGDGNVEWTILDIAAARVFGKGDFAPYLGVGVGIHSIRLEQEFEETASGYGGPSYTHMNSREQSETAPTVDLVFGMLGFRTFDFEVVIEGRYHHVFEDFDQLGGDGAGGFMFTVGTNR